MARRLAAALAVLCAVTAPASLVFDPQPAMGGDTLHVADFFDSQSYSGSNGTDPWDSAWKEKEGDGPAAGVIQVVNEASCASSFCVRFGGTAVPLGGNGFSRTVDLTTATAATLSYDYRRVLLGAPGGRIKLKLEDETGFDQTPRWFDLVATDASPLHDVVDLSAYTGTVLTINFLGVNSGSSYLFVDNVEINATLGGSPTTTATTTTTPPTTTTAPPTTTTTTTTTTTPPTTTTAPPATTTTTTTTTTAEPPTTTTPPATTTGPTTTTTTATPPVTATTSPTTTTEPPLTTVATTTTTTTTVPPTTDVAQPPPDPEPPADFPDIPRYTEKATLALTGFDTPASPGSAAPSRTPLTDLMAVITTSRVVLGMNILPSLALGLLVAWLSVRGIGRPEDDGPDKPDSRAT